VLVTGTFIDLFIDSSLCISDPRNGLTGGGPAYSIGPLPPASSVATGRSSPDTVDHPPSGRGH